MKLGLPGEIAWPFHDLILMFFFTRPSKDGYVFVYIASESITRLSEAAGSHATTEKKATGMNYQPSPTTLETIFLSFSWLSEKLTNPPFFGYKIFSRARSNINRVK